MEESLQPLKFKVIKETATLKEPVGWREVRQGHRNSEERQRPIGPSKEGQARALVLWPRVRLRALGAAAPNTS